MGEIGTAHKVIRIFVSGPQEITVGKRNITMHTSLRKEEVNDPLFLTFTSLEGDVQADLKFHGGTDRAVLAYSVDNYSDWEVELGEPILPVGAFGENFLVDGPNEEGVCIGDIFQIGDAIVEVSQPRRPCRKPGRYWGIGNLASLMKSSGRTGWFLRVLQEGTVQAGLPLKLVERPFPQWTVARTNQLSWDESCELDSVQELARCPILADGWRSMLSRKLTKVVHQEEFHPLLRLQDFEVVLVSRDRT